MNTNAAVPRVIAIVNQKGGVGKTTTTINLGAALADRGQRVLLIDLDPQAHTTLGLGIDPDACRLSMYHVLTKGSALEQAIAPTGIDRLSLAPAHIDLAAAEVELLNATAREQILREQLEPALMRFDFVLLDCPPSLSVLTVNALSASAEVIVPVQAQFYALAGFNKLLDTIDTIRRRVNRRLRIRGILVTQYDGRTTYQREFMERLSSRLGSHYPIFNTMIKQGVRVQEAAHSQQPVIHFDPKSAVAEAYSSLAEEVLRA